MEDEEYKKLPIDERCVHKLWKARVNGYEEVTKLFKQIDDEKSPEFAKYLGLVKKFVIDSNAVGQEKGLEATLAYIENYAFAGKAVSEVMSGIVMKCMAAPKAKTRELAFQITLMCIEIEKYEAVQDELLKGMDQKNPKIVSACICISTASLREFGIKIVNVKPLAKKIPVLFADRDKTVRDEARLLAIELFRWMGNALRPQLNTLQPVQLTELESEFAKLEGQKAVPTRYIRSQQQKQAKLAAAIEEADGCDEGEEEEETPQIDAYDIADPVDILSKLPKDFYDKLEAKKWQDRKEALENLENLLKTPKLENGDYGDLVRGLKKMIQKDSNVIVVASAGRCLAGLATGLKKRFQIYSGACTSALLEKFKEKKQNVVTAIREAIDAVYSTTNLEAVLEDVLEALGNKNPSVKAETASFLARAFTKTLPTALNKKLLKGVVGALVKTVNEPDPTVRDVSSEALGTLMKLVGDKAILPFMGDLEKDNLKMTKMREFCDKAVIVVKVPAAKKEKPVSAPTNKAAATRKPGEATKSAPAAPKATKKVLSGSTVTRKKTQILSGSATVVRSKGPKPSAAKQPPKPIERELSDEEVDEALSEILASNIVGDVASSDWKTRLAAVDQILSDISGLDAKSLPSQALVKFVARKPGLKDTNFQVLKSKLDIVKYLAQNATFSSTTANCCLTELTEKFGDAKNGQSVCDTMTAIAEATSFPEVTLVVLDFVMGQKSPKVIQEGLIWLSKAILEFGFSGLNSKMLIEHSKKALNSSNPSVRQSGIVFLGTIYLYIGPSLISSFDNEKAQIREQLAVEFDKHDGEKPPIPSKGVKKSDSVGSLDGLEDGEEDQDAFDRFEDAVQEQQIARTDISAQITESLLNELNDKNWKVRNEALTKIGAIIQEAQRIKPNVGDLAQALAHRLNDSNTKIAQSSLNLCEAMAKAMDTGAKQHVRTLFPGFLQGLGDNKSWMRTAAMDAINTFSEQCGYKEFFEAEMIADALKAGSPVLRTELWTWLSDCLPKIPVKSIPREELIICIPHLYTNLEDRSAEVRKSAQEAILGFMIHVGYETMVKQTEKLKPGSKQNIMQLLEKVRPNLPAKPLPKKCPSEETKAVRGTKPVANSKNAVAKPKSATIPKPVAGGRKKEDDVDTSPLLTVNNMKHQRTIDESKLKVLKWNFTSPREEFVESLRDQMSSANVNRTLISNMFHIDFRYHLKAIECLTEDLNDNSQALICNLDLILKWLTLRFFDTNPSVLLKGLEYLNLVFLMLDEGNYKMLENEATSFIPYLILKIGDPKDTVRNGVKSLFKQIVNVYPVSRLFTCLMEGVKSKNARQRAECLEVMGTIIDDYGLNVCMPSPAACLKEVAKQISDRDNSVRNAALNCVVQAYYIVGEKVYKMVGNISDKDMSLLEERIKRASKKPQTIKSPIKCETTIIQQKDTHSPIRNNNDNYNNNEEVDLDNDIEPDEEEDLPPLVLPSQIVEKEREVEGPYRLDPEFMKELDAIKVELPNTQLREFDLAFLDEPIAVPSLSDAKPKAMPMHPPKPLALDATITNLRKSLSPEKPSLESTIKSIGSNDINRAIKAMEQMIQNLMSSKSNLMIDHEDLFMSALAQQLRYLSKLDIQKQPVEKAYTSILAVIEPFYTNRILGRHLSVEVIQDILKELIGLLLSGKLELCKEGDSFIKIINLHCVKIIEKSDHTNAICALLQLMGYCLRTNASLRTTELVMKCHWRVIKLLPQWDIDGIQFDKVLVEIHKFFKEFPPILWKNKSNDMPLRTIKTIVHSCVKVRGNDILKDLTRVPDARGSEIDTYVTRVLKNVNSDKQIQQSSSKPEPQNVLQQQPSRNILSKAVHNQLTEIFQKIGNREETKDGLVLLYNFTQQHPEADIEPFLTKCSSFFQDYIKNGLKSIETRRQTKTETIADKVVEKVQATLVPAASESDPMGRGPEYWKERLTILQNKYHEGNDKDVDE